MQTLQGAGLFPPGTGATCANSATGPNPMIEGMVCHFGET